MIAGPKPYPAYKDSGVPWLGEVPEHWDVRRLKHICRLAYGDAMASENRCDGDIAVYGSNGQVGHHSEPNTKAPCLVIGRKGSFGKVNFSSEPVFAIDTTFFVDATNSSADIRWLYYLLGWLRLDEVSKDSAVPGLDREDAYQRLGVYPPLREQAAIVRFLDYADRRIRRYIRAKQKLIKLLEEQKQAIIHRAVTRGLDPNVRLKPSGVEWLGNIPEHWMALPLKRWVSTKITDGPHETPQWLDKGIPFISAEAMIRGRLEFSRRRGFISRESHETYCRKCRPQRNDIFMCKSGATTGKVAIVETDDEFSVWSPLGLIRVRPDRVAPRLLLAVLQARYVQRQVQDTWSYGTQPNLSMAAMERLIVVLPPIQEQIDLLAHVDAMTKSPSSAMERALQEISFLREYRTRLIADVVTGKLDVREAAARLPEEREETEPLDELTVEQDADDIDDDSDPASEEAES